MKRFSKIIQVFSTLVLFTVLTGCNLAQPAQPTPTEVDVSIVMTSAAATAFVQLTQIAGMATATLPPTATLTPTPQATAPAAETPAAGGGTTSTPPPLVIGMTDTPAQPAQTAQPGLPTPIPSFTPLPAVGGGPTVAAPLCKNSLYIADITVPDYTQFKPWEKFYKVWRMQNTGTCTWDEGFYFAAWAGPPSMGLNLQPWKIKEKHQFVPPGGVVDIGINMYAPGDPGEYVAHWSWYDDNGKPFGQSVTVVIVVVK
ncbi:MAG: NBR1-Ig-like domain-containing protein [Anaerolineales bacterium]|nr:NBR1-Ig-like domain-containing protein [Anaerolineales bacterium]MCX7754982.1 NBR1-Ig-like domain-containing protein [Anaerolineales bacterium]MDW8277360.1 NBR1-Ig-like domain-containing protein [Anaerolineales bacterium]